MLVIMYLYLKTGKLRILLEQVFTKSMFAFEGLQTVLISSASETGGYKKCFMSE